MRLTFRFAQLVTARGVRASAEYDRTVRDTGSVRSEPAVAAWARVDRLYRVARYLTRRMDRMLAE